MRRGTWRRPFALACASVLVLAACGGDDDDDSGATTTTAAVGAAATTEAEGTEDTAGEALAGDTEDTATTEAGDDTADTGGASGEYGLIDEVYVGPNDFTIDPAECPEDWDPMQGITDDSIKFFTSMPKAGPLAGFGLVGDGISSYFQYVNEEKGGVDGRMLSLDIKDDAYQPDKTKTNVDEALGTGSYAGMLTIIGTPNNLAVWDTLNDECMPQLLNGTGAPQWGDINGHPWTSGMQLDYASEAGLWAEWLKAEHPDAKKIAAITFNSDFGKSYVAGFDRFKGDDMEMVAQEYHEPTAPDLTNQFTTIAASGADVVLIETSGTFCTQAMAELEKNQDFNPIVIMSATCQSLSQFFQPLVDQGLTGADTYSIQYLKDVNDEQFADDEIVKLFHEVAAAQGLDDKQTTYATGWIFGMFMEAILNEAATYEGGINRGNIALAARNITFQNPFALDGVVMETAGASDAYLFEGGQMAKYTVTDPTQLGSWVKEGELIDNNGGIGNYDDFLSGE